jgi:membrane fusion protein
MDKVGKVGLIMTKNPLFRREVSDNKRHKNYGSVFINIPTNYAVLSVGFSLLTLGIILLFIFAEVSEKFIVKGYLNSNKGVVRVYPNKLGIIIKQYVKQGDTVKKGDPLFLIDTSYDGLANTKHPGILDQLTKRRDSLAHEIHIKLAYIQELKKLLKKKYIPLTTYTEKHEELVSLKNNMHMLDSEIIRYKQELSYIMRAPSDGTVSSLMYTLGQYVNPAKSMLKILPDNAELVVELFIPIQESGFIIKDNKVIIRYDAYPYQRFGSYQAVIQTISQSILTDQEEDKPLSIGQPYYKVVAHLDKQFVTLYGADKKLQQDMTVTAVIVGAKRKIWQWVLDPIFSYYGDLLV